MKKMQYALVITLLGIAITGYSQEKNTEIMVKRIFQTLKNKDEEGFVKLFPDVVTMKSFVQLATKGDTAGKADKMNEYFNEMSDSSLQKEFSGIFKKSIKKGEDKGIDWSKTEWVSFTADTAIADDDGLKTTSLNGNIYFRAGAKDYFMKYDDIIWFESKGWYGVSIRYIDEKGKENGPNIVMDMDENEKAGMAADSALASDSIAIAIDEMPKQKPKPPVKSKPVQKKIQTPARKPN
jgi:hypothetical protein